jgi:hypothetical protein
MPQCTENGNDEIKGTSSSQLLSRDFTPCSPVEVSEDNVVCVIRMGANGGAVG